MHSWSAAWWLDCALKCTVWPRCNEKVEKLSTDSHHHPKHLNLYPATSTHRPRRSPGHNPRLVQPDCNNIYPPHSTNERWIPTMTTTMTKTAPLEIQPPVLLQKRSEFAPPTTNSPGSITPHVAISPTSLKHIDRMPGTTKPTTMILTMTTTADPAAMAIEYAECTPTTTNALRSTVSTPPTNPTQRTPQSTRQGRTNLRWSWLRRRYDNLMTATTTTIKRGSDDDKDETIKRQCSNETTMQQWLCRRYDDDDNTMNLQSPMMTMQW